MRELRGAALIVNGTAEHVHSLMRVPARVSVADAVRVIKCNSSRWVHEKWPQHGQFAWQSGYGAFSVSESGVEAVKRYIAEQEKHHKRRTFQQEFVAFLRKNNVQYDERYVWE